VSWRASAYIKELRTCPNGEVISCYEKLVGLVLADSHQDKTHAYTYPSVQTLAADAGVDERTCRRILRSLERKGVIVSHKPERQGRGQVTFYRFPALDQEQEKNGKGGQNDRLSPVEMSAEGGQNDRLFSDERRAKGGQKGGKTRTGIKGLTGTETQKQKPNPPDPPAGGRSSAVADVPGRDGAGEQAIEHAVEQTMSDCVWTKRRLRETLRRVIVLERSKGTPPATTALDIAAAWKFQAEHSHLLRGKFGPANFLELGVWKDANLLMWDHERMDREHRGRL